MSASLANFVFPTENMDSKTLYAYAVAQAAAWKIFSETLGNTKVSNSVDSWLENHINDFDADMIRLATPALVIEASKKKFPELSTEEIETLESKINEMLSSRKQALETIVTKPVVVEKPKKKSPAKKKTVEPVVEIPSDPVTETSTEAPVAEPVVEKPKKKTAGKKKTVEPVVESTSEATSEKPAKKSAGKKKQEKEADDAASDTSSKKSEKKKRGPTAYNLFIKAEMERLRAADPALNHKVAMALAVAAWKAKANNTSETTTEEPTSEESTAHPIPEYPVENSVTLEQALESEL